MTGNAVRYMLPSARQNHEPHWACQRRGVHCKRSHFWERIGTRSRSPTAPQEVDPACVAHVAAMIVSVMRRA
jgi:hypothetical protein